MNLSAGQKPIIYVIDDDLSVRVSLEDLFASIGLEVVTFESVQLFLNHARGDRPSCLILDVRMPGQSGTDFHLHMAGLGIRIPVIFVTGHGDIAMGVNAIKRGALEFLSKPFRDHELLDAVQHALEEDEKRLSREHTISRLQDRQKLLTPGERDVLGLVVQGCLNKQIAAQLGIKEVTVKVRRAHVMRKMQAGSLADLVRIFDAIDKE